jgi:Xaa-Pro aminopeptidase
MHRPEARTRSDSRPRVPVAATAFVLLAAACAGGPAPETGSPPDPCAAALAAAPEHPVAPERLAARRAALAGLMGTGVAVVPGSSPAGRPGMQQRPSSDFTYLTGLQLPGAWLVIAAREGAPDASILFVRPDSVRPALAAPVGALTGITDVRCLAGAAGELEARLRTSAVPGPDGRLYVSTTMRGTPDPAVTTAIDTTGLPVSPIGPLLAALRPAKDSEELARLRRASEITAAGVVAAMLAVRPGMREDSLQAVLEREFRARGASGTSFPSIVASGANALELHYSRNDSTMEAGQLVLVDVGAEYAGYAGDVTRTFPVSGRFTDRQRALYGLVLETQRAAIEAVRPGVTIEELNRVARERMASASGDTCGERSCDAFFIHGLSHHLGLDVHDPGLPGQPLAPGMVITIEPGLYIPDEGIGIRIEDDVLVTPEGHEVLSAEAPKSVEEIEARVAGTR